MSKAYSIANIARVDITVEDEQATKYTLIEVASRAEASPIVSEGKNEELRVKNTIHAQNNTEDIVKAYDIKLNTVKAVMPVLALIDGGTWSEETETYEGPEAGITTSRKYFTTDIFSEEKDYNGDVKGYIQFTFRHCVGKPVAFVIEDGQFITQELVLRSAPKYREKPISFKRIEQLPV